MRCVLAVLAVSAGAVSPLGRGNPVSVPSLGPHGIGSVRFGETEAAAAAALAARFGAPSARFSNAGCGPRYTEVAWGHLYAEFRLHRFAGFRYLASGWPLRHVGKASPAKPIFPKLLTTKGISLSSTLADLRAAYRPLRLIGTDRWQSPDGLVFYDDAEHDPAPPTSRIREIKFGTCGDF